ncbi:MAG TPA: DNA replication/repair protein RecF, partial [Deltaproteobacteria bacterium]|nr:DNA replication/repair protein RecF [Deltaproteobacteria bacterium]
MQLTRVSISCFRNIKSVQFDPARHFNMFYGLNGQGKTSLMEALYLLGSNRSFRQVRIPDVIMYGEHTASVQGDIECGGIKNRIKLIVERAGRKTDIDGKAVQKASELHGRLNSVVFSPDDIAMVKGGPENRRRYLDRAVYTGDAGYLHCWHAYNRILKQRNALLKNRNMSGLEVWTEKLAEQGAEVIRRRSVYVKFLNLALQQVYAAISGDAGEMPTIVYQPEGILAENHLEIRQQLLSLMEKSKARDERFGTTTSGPHRDDLAFNLNGHTLKAFGSQGQQKSFILALKMAEIEHLSSVFGEPPLFLVDDLGSELDAQRRKNLMDFLNDRMLQTFITTTERSSALV